MSFDQNWSGRRVFLTGHTGFKGSWLVHLLSALGARVWGYSLAPETTPNLCDLTEVSQLVECHHISDICNVGALQRALSAAEPELVIHMAAQPLVRRSYGDPLTTWNTNVMGTVNLLEAVRASASVRAVIIVTTDKCYENVGWHWGYREIDRLGGHDPYSASKAASEHVVESYRHSYFDKSGILLASARAGNVIGGGDWSEDRLIPDAARAVAVGKPLVIRNPAATRPWQHVLECVGGYLRLAECLLRGERQSASAYNFGPDRNANVTVGELLGRLQEFWVALDWHYDAVAAASGPHEATFLYLDSSKAHRELAWRPRWTIDDALRATAEWYTEVIADPAAAPEVTKRQVDLFRYT